MWKVKLQEILCNKYKFNVTVCHYPPGASKWNAIEHRLFSEISKNWRGTPLTSYETVLKYTKRTKTKTGLKVNAILVEKQNEDRNNQFEYINKMIIKFAKNRMPAISVDTKKKEPIGNFKNPGTRYKREADLTNDHDFLTYATGIAALYGVYDQRQNKGFVSI